MNRLTYEELLQFIEFYYQNARSVRKVHRALLSFYGQFKRPTEAAIRAIATKFCTKFTLLDIKPPTRLRRVRTEENISAVSASVNEDHLLLIRSAFVAMKSESKNKIFRQCQSVRLSVRPQNFCTVTLENG